MLLTNQARLTHCVSVPLCGLLYINFLHYMILNRKSLVTVEVIWNREKSKLSFLKFLLSDGGMLQPLRTCAAHYLTPSFLGVMADQL